MLAAPPNVFSKPLPHHALPALIWTLIILGFIAVVVVAASIANYFEDRREGGSAGGGPSEAQQLAEVESQHQEV